MMRNHFISVPFASSSKSHYGLYNKAKTGITLVDIMDRILNSRVLFIPSS